MSMLNSTESTDIELRALLFLCGAHSQPKQVDVHVSQYLRNLNAVSPHDTTADDGFNIEDDQDDLALFTNTQFFDFDSGQNMDYQAQPIKPDVKPAGRHSSSSSDDMAAAPPSSMDDITNLDFMSGEWR